MEILLASQSARRKELLAQLGFKFSTVSIECDEIYPSDLAVDNVASYLSSLKSNAFRSLKSNEVLITADTIVALDHIIFGKPKGEKHALEMLTTLAGKTHQVYTAVTIKTTKKTITRTDVASVTFSDISSKEALQYIKRYSPFDKAGSYGIQEWLGMAKITNITGSFYTIMGLPTHIVYEILKDLQRESA